MIIRMANKNDVEQLHTIYAPYVEHTAISFEYEVPSVAEFAQRMDTTLEKYPYLVAIKDDQIVGYTYASAFKQRAAYDWAVETSIYLQEGSRGKGIGKQLYQALEDHLKRQNILNLNACVAYTEPKDPHLDHGSTLFHENLGYRRVARFTKCGYKFGTWYDMIWLEKIIGEHGNNPAPFIPITQLLGSERKGR